MYCLEILEHITVLACTIFTSFDSQCFLDVAIFLNHCILYLLSLISTILAKNLMLLLSYRFIAITEFTTAD
jgi:hypothetical protein